MQYESKVSYRLDLINSVFESINVEHLLNNKDFIIDDNFHYEHYVKFVLKKPHSINLEMIFVDNAIQINLDRTNESFEWSEEQIQENGKDMLYFIKVLFTSTIKVEYCGANYTKIYFYDNKGICVKILKYVSGIYLRVDCKTKEYKPIYAIMQ